MDPSPSSLNNLLDYAVARTTPYLEDSRPSTRTRTNSLKQKKSGAKDHFAPLCGRQVKSIPGFRRNSSTCSKRHCGRPCGRNSDTWEHLVGNERLYRSKSLSFDPVVCRLSVRL